MYIYEASLTNQVKWVLCLYLEMQADILKMERTITRMRREKSFWLEYKSVGSVQRSKQIDLLEKELKDMQQSYEEMTGWCWYLQLCGNDDLVSALAVLRKWQVGDKRLALHFTNI